MYFYKQNPVITAFRKGSFYNVLCFKIGVAAKDRPKGLTKFKLEKENIRVLCLEYEAWHFQTLKTVFNI